jgi:hypothetical protein
MNFEIVVEQITADFDGDFDFGAMEGWERRPSTRR